MTAIVFAIFFQGLNLVLRFRAAVAAPVSTTGTAAAARRTAEARGASRGAPADFPLPIYVGAQNAEYGQMEFNGIPIHRCEFEVHANAWQILDYYRRQLKARGWREPAADLLENALAAEAQGAGSAELLQNETLLRDLDRRLEREANFTRSGWHARVDVGPGTPPAPSRVGIQVVGAESPEALADVLRHLVSGAGDGVEYPPPASFSQKLGDQQAHTTLRVRPESPARVAAELIAEYEAGGWTLAGPTPTAPNAPNSRSAVMTRAEQMLFLHVAYDEESGLSRALVSVLGPS